MSIVMEKPKVINPRTDISFVDELPYRSEALFVLNLHGYEIDYIISLIHNDTVMHTKDWSKWRSTANPAVDELVDYLSDLKIPKRKTGKAKHRRKHSR